MSIQNIIKNLKTVKKLHLHPPKRYQEILNVVSSKPPMSGSSTSSSLSNLVLADPRVKSSTCLKFFNFLIKNQSFISFKPDLQAQWTLIGRLVKARNFSQAENLFRSVSIHESSGYPFADIASPVEIFCDETLVKAKLFNLMLKVYSDNGKFDQVLVVFDYIKCNGIEIDGMTTVHLLALKRADQVDPSIDFLYRMLESNVEVSEYSLSVVVAGLCSNGEIERSRELVEEMVDRGTELSTITFNTMLDACSKIWNFVELDLILGLMEKEGLGYDIHTCRILINGFTSFGKVKEAESLIKEMHDKGLKVETHLYNLLIMLINGCCRACLMFDEMTERNVNQNADTHLAVISGLCKNGEMEKAMKYCNELQNKGIEGGCNVQYLD